MHKTFVSFINFSFSYDKNLLWCSINRLLLSFMYFVFYAIVSFKSPPLGICHNSTNYSRVITLSRIALLKKTFLPTIYIIKIIIWKGWMQVGLIILLVRKPKRFDKIIYSMYGYLLLSPIILFHYAKMR